MLGLARFWISEIHISEVPLYSEAALSFLCDSWSMTIVLCVFFPQHPLIIGKKKHKDIQFYTEVCLFVCLSVCMFVCSSVVMHSALCLYALRLVPLSVTVKPLLSGRLGIRGCP